MSEPTGQHLPETRLQSIAVLCVTIAWQVYVIIAVYSRAANFGQLFAGLSAELPPLARLFFISYRWWFIFPLLFVGLLLNYIYRSKPARWHSPLLIGSSLAVGFSLQAFANEALYKPLFSLIKHIG